MSPARARRTIKQNRLARRPTKAALLWTPPLEWWIGSNGSWFADASNARYSVAALGNRFHVGINGYPIGNADTVAEAKDLAEAHNQRDDMP